MIAPEDRHHFVSRSVPGDEKEPSAAQALMRVVDDMGWLLASIEAEATFHEAQAKRLERFKWLRGTRTEVDSHRETARRLRLLMDGRTPP